MYSDSQPCAECGSEVVLRPHPGTAAQQHGEPVGPPDGVVGEGDEPVDVRECTNPACPTRQAGGPTP